MIKKYHLDISNKKKKPCQMLIKKSISHKLKKKQILSLTKTLPNVERKMRKVCCWWHHMSCKGQLD